MQKSDNSFFCFERDFFLMIIRHISIFLDTPPSYQVPGKWNPHIYKSGQVWLYIADYYQIQWLNKIEIYISHSKEVWEYTVQHRYGLWGHQGSTLLSVCSLFSVCSSHLQNCLKAQDAKILPMTFRFQGALQREGGRKEKEGKQIFTGFLLYYIY